MDSKVCTRCVIGVENYFTEPATPHSPEIILCDECCRKLVEKLRRNNFISHSLIEHFIQVGD